MSKQSLEHDIFIAYAAVDRDFALSLYEALRQSCRVFIDTQSMSPGDLWPKELKNAQQRSLITVVILSKNSVSSPYVEAEIASGIDLYRRRWPSHRVVPVYLDESARPVAPPYGLEPIVGIYNGRDNIDAIVRRLLALVKEIRTSHAAIADAATVKPARDLTAGSSREHDFIIEDFIPDLYVACEGDRVALEKLNKHRSLLIEGQPKCGKTRLAWELIRSCPDAVVFIPRAKEPPPDSSLADLADREVIMFADDLNRSHLETNLISWRNRLEAAARQFQMICAAEDGRGRMTLENHQLSAQFLNTLPVDARFSLGAHLFDKGTGWTLAQKLRVSREQFDRHFDGTAWSVIYIKRAESFRDSSRPMNNLPSLPKPLGRNVEVKSCLDKLLKDDVRLLTISGSSGVGKTVLGVAVAGEIYAGHLAEGFDDGVCFVDASKVTNPRHLSNEIAAALGFVETSDSSLVFFLGTKRLLLLLDNFEYVSCAAGFVRELVDRTKHLKILVTSQASLSEYLNDQLIWERLEPLKPLDVSVLDGAAADADFDDHPAVQVFTRRLEQLGRNTPPSDSDYRLIAEICVLVQGLPLALQIVASYSNVFGLKRAVNRLRGQSLGAMDMDGRLRRAFEMSYDNLGGDRDEEEKAQQQELLRRLTVFVGSFTFECVSRLYEELKESPAELDKCMASLIRRSLLEVEADMEEPRYQMLQSIRVYAHGLLEASGKAPDIRAAHARLYAKLVRREEPHLNRPERHESLNLLEAEHSNLRAVLQWCMETDGEEHTGVELAGRLFWFWNLRSYFEEGRRWASEFVNKTEALGDTEARARALYCDGGLGFLEGHYDQAHEALTRSVEMWRRLGNDSGLGYALIILGMVQANREGIEQARLHEEESVRIFRAINDRWGLALALNDLGNVVTADGVKTLLDAGVVRQEEADEMRREQVQSLYNEGRRYYDESRRIWKEMGDDWGLPLTLTNLGTLSYGERKYAEAQGHFEQALEIHKGTGSKWGRATALRGLGRVWAAQGDFEQAARAYYQSYMLHREVGRAQLIAECLDGFADLASGLGQTERAGCMLGAAKRLRDDWNLWKVPGQRKRFEIRVARARGDADGGAFERAMAVGYGWGPQEQLDNVTDYVREWTPGQMI